MKRIVAKKLKELRNELDYSTEYVSKELKQMGFLISPNTLYNYENGISQPKADMFLNLCRIYKVTSFDIFFDDVAEQTTSNMYDGLNDVGMQKANEYIEDLKANPKYTQNVKSTNTTSDFDTASDVRTNALQVKTNKT